MLAAISSSVAPQRLFLYFTYRQEMKIIQILISYIIFFAMKSGLGI